MKNLTIILSVLVLLGCSPKKEKADGILTTDSLAYHPIRVDTSGMILPWFSADLGKSYDTVISLTWNFWKNMESDSNGIRYYMNHQVWKPEHDMRGLGGDQISMALSSWNMLHMYTGDTSILSNMKYMADYYLAHSLSDSTDAWPFLPYPYNTDIHSGRYDGDMRLGKGYLQPDKAGSFGHELVVLYMKTDDKKYMNAAIRIAKTLAHKVVPGDSLTSPLPFKVHANTGEIGKLFDRSGEIRSSYTTNWAGTLELFEDLYKLDAKNTDLYKPAFNTILKWMNRYPVQNNRWGPFFEDIMGWSDTQINAMTFAWYILLHIELFPNGLHDVKRSIDWVHQELGNKEWEKYGVLAIHEQTAYRVPGNSHTARQAAVELTYCGFAGDSALRVNAIRRLNWATYMVDWDGANRYPRDDIWLTDGYGDYIRHYLRAMACNPALAPSDRDHMLSTTSVIKRISYRNDVIIYYPFENRHREVFRLTKKPRKVTVGGIPMPEVECSCQMGYNWKKLESGGVLTINTDSGNETYVVF